MLEFLYVANMTSSSIHVMQLVNSTYQQYTKSILSHINVGTGVNRTIRELA